MRSMVTVEEAEQLILTEVRDFGTEETGFLMAGGRILAEPIFADRDFPPFNRVMMDGIALRYEDIEKGHKNFIVKGIQAAGSRPLELSHTKECIEIMTGAAVPLTADTIIPYEDVSIKDGIATIGDKEIRKGQFIHYKGSDKEAGALLVPNGRMIDPSVIGVLATVGKTSILVKKLPRVVIISTGDELRPVDSFPSPFEIRISNSFAIGAVLSRYGIAADNKHLRDDREVLLEEIPPLLKDYDCLILSGGVSMGRFDYLPQIFEETGVKKIFHKVQQRPGKPFWFGIAASGVPVFAFPGNPVSTFLCLHRYFLPWLEACLGLSVEQQVAVLQEPVIFKSPLHYFMQVSLSVNEEGICEAYPREGNGSGDLGNLVSSNAFMELPLNRDTFNKGEMYRVWPFKT